VAAAGTMTHAARGLLSFAAKSASDDAPIAPSASSSRTGSGVLLKATHSWPSRISRRTSPAPMRPSPIIPSCMRCPLSAGVDRRGPILPEIFVTRPQAGSTGPTETSE
jgi:hypothetical protein